MAHLLILEKLLKKISKMDILDYDILEDIFKVSNTVLRQTSLEISIIKGGFI